MVRGLLLIFLFWIIPAALAAQDTADRPHPAVLVADNVFIEADRRLVAQGNVEAFQGETRLRARSSSSSSMISSTRPAIVSITASGLFIS